jgi:hypothetical protein
VVRVCVAAVLAQLADKKATMRSTNKIEIELFFMAVPFLFFVYTYVRLRRTHMYTGIFLRVRQQPNDLFIL